VHWLPLALLAALALLALLLAGCAATLVAPPAPAQPRPVYVLDHGRHTSLLLTGADARLWRYAYGDWRWYVDFERGPSDAVRALLWPSRAALGRATLHGPADIVTLQPQVGSLIETLLAFDAEGERVDRLLAELDVLFESRSHDLRSSPELKLDVIEHPVPYTLTHNSNHMVAEWLKALGFEVRGSPMTGRWKVAPAR
jgi:hypothetical protein